MLQKSNNQLIKPQERILWPIMYKIIKLTANNNH